MSRVPPHDLIAEAAVLSAVLLEPERLADIGELEPRHFYSPANGRIYEAILAVAAARKPIDNVTVASELRDRQRLAEVGGQTYLTHIADAAPAVVNLSAYADSVRDKWRARQVIALGQRIAAEGYGDVGDFDQWADRAARELSTIATGGAATCNYHHIGDLLHESEQRNMEARLSGRPPLRFPSGIKDLDRVVSFRPGQLVIVGAPSGVGKTALVGGLARHVANFGAWEPEQRLACLDERPHVLVMALEMEAIDICERIWCGAAQVSQRAWETHRLDADGYDRMAAVAPVLRETGLYVGYRPRLTLADLKRNIRAAAAEARDTRYGDVRGRLRMVALDYLGLMDIPVAKSERFDQAIGRAVWEMKQIAEEEQLCFVCVSQLNRMYAQRKDGRPTMADLRDSGQIEHHADTILFAYREDLLDHASDLKGFGEIIVAKQRKGQSSTTVNVRWRPEYTAYEGLTDEDRYHLGEILEQRRAKAKGGRNGQGH